MVNHKDILAVSSHELPIIKIQCFQKYCHCQMNKTKSNFFTFQNSEKDKLILFFYQHRQHQTDFTFFFFIDFHVFFCMLPKKGLHSYKQGRLTLSLIEKANAVLLFNKSNCLSVRGRINY